MAEAHEIQVLEGIIDAGVTAMASRLADAADVTPPAELAGALDSVFRALWDAMMLEKQHQITQQQN